MYFQAFDYKFLDLDNNDQTIAPTYTKGRVWLKHIGQSNTLTARITQLMYLLENTGKGSFPMNHVHALVKKLPLRLDIIYCMSVNNTSNHGTPFGVPSTT